MNNKSSHILYGFFLLLLLSACSKKIDQVALPIPQYTRGEVYNALVEHNVDFDWWVGKGKVNIESPDQSGSGKAYLRMQKDSIIWMSAKKFKVEGMRMKIIPDSFWIKYNLEKIYQAGSVNELMGQNKLGVGFTDFQQLLAGNIMLPDSVQAEFTQEGSKIQLKDQDFDFSYQYFFDPYTLDLVKVFIEDRYGRRIKIEYEEYKKIEEGNYILPHKRTLLIENEIRMEFDFSEILINVPKKTAFSISNRYRQVSL